MGAEGPRRGRAEADHRLLPQGPLNPELSVVIPCRDEEKSLARYPSDLFPALDSLGATYEVVIVDDGSTDGTGNAARAIMQARADRRDVSLVSLSPNRGLGGAIRAGAAQAKGDWIATLDADLTFAPSALKDMLAKARETGADLVAGSPYLRPDDLSSVPWARRLPSLMVNALYRGAFGMTLTAYTPVLRLYRASFLKSLELTSDGFEVNAEIAARAVQARRKVAEVPAALTTRTEGASKLQRWRELRRHAALIARLLGRSPDTKA